jgi:DNA-binding protein H-NS
MTVPTPLPKDKSPLVSRATAHDAPESAPSRALGIDVATLSDEGLQALAAEAQTELARRKAKREADFLAAIRDQAQILGIAPARLAAALGIKSAAARAQASDSRDGRSVVKPKFWNPADHAQRWAGRGAPPKWYAAHLAAGGTEADLRIPEGEG